MSNLTINILATLCRSWKKIEQGTWQSMLPSCHSDVKHNILQQSVTCRWKKISRFVTKYAILFHFRHQAQYSPTVGDLQMEEDLQVRDKANYLHSFLKSCIKFSNQWIGTFGIQICTFDLLQRVHGSSFEDSLVRAARTRTVASTNYSVHASSRKMLGSSSSLCNEAESPRLSAILIAD